MSDLISRKATLEHIEKIRQDALMMDDTRRASIVMNGMHLCEKAVMDQPSAQPTQLNTPNTLEALDCISRQAVIDGIMQFMPEEEADMSTTEQVNYSAWVSALSCVKTFVRTMPSAQPEIIRCKDCKWWRSDHTCHEHSLVSPMSANEFCSRAERRNDG